MVGQGGLEPPTPRLSSVCSNQLSYWPRMRGVAQISGKDARSAPAMAFATTRHAGKAGLLADSRDFGDQAAHLSQLHPEPTQADTS